MPFWNRILLAAVATVVSFAGPATTAAAAEDRPNVLFVAIDDLRPELGVYGSRALTPTLDRLAGEGMIFERAYCQQALCAPSRTSLMTGLRPGIPGINATDSQKKPNIKAAVDRVVTLPENLRNAGYFTMNVGKSFHTYDTTADGAWDVQMRPGGGHYQLAENKQRERAQREAIQRDGRSARWRVGRGHATESADAPEESYQTHRIATRAIGMLDDQVKQRPGEPFFLSVGFYKPHLPFVAPQTYWDLYEREAFPVPPRAEPTGIAKFALPESWYEVRQYGDIPRRGDLDDAKTREMIHGYHACVSFVDAQVERLLDALDAHDLRENTIVVVWSDHGFKLGDYGDWSKYTNMEVDTHVPLFVSGPGVAAGARTNALVELIDL